MSEMMNVNETVWVRLTDLGRSIHRKNHEEIFKGFNSKPPYRAPIEINGWAGFQLWVLMREFGAQCGNGCSTPFETEIRLTAPVST
jgi:hypothetical protein